MELKKGKPNANELVPLLQAGNDDGDRIIPRGSRVRFVPIAVFGGELTRIELLRFANPANRIRFRGERADVKFLRCKRPLAEALRRS